MCWMYDTQVTAIPKRKKAPARVYIYIYINIYIYIYQWLRWGFYPFEHLTALEEAEIIPGEHSVPRIKPLTLTNGRCIAVTPEPERALASVGECRPLNI